MLTDEYRYRILKRLEADPEISQRELAKELGISLGRANYCLKALIERGLVKANNFRKMDNRSGYAYYLTSKGFEEKARITLAFLKFKMSEYEALKVEIEGLRQEVSTLTSEAGTHSGGRA